MLRVGSAPDWRVAEDYAPLAAMDRPAFAWELLRRNHDYRREAAAAVDPGDADLVVLDDRAAGLGSRWGLAFPGRSPPRCGGSPHPVAAGF